MKPIDRSQSEIIANLEKIILEQNRRLNRANQIISDLEREIEVNDEFVAWQMSRLIDQYEEIITNMLTPSLN